MNFNDCYNIIKDKFYAKDLHKIDSDFTGVVCVTGDGDNKYIYLEYQSNSGHKIIEPVKHDSANIVVTFSLETFEDIIAKRIDPFKAFTTGKIKAKGNIFLALSLFKKLKS